MGVKNDQKTDKFYVIMENSWNFSFTKKKQTSNKTKENNRNYKNKFYKKVKNLKNRKKEKVNIDIKLGSVAVIIYIMNSSIII